ncbi:MAG: Spi family protease inhibitor [Flammeovirgaceae bacterium]
MIRCKDEGLNPEAKLNQPQLTGEEIKRLILLDSTFAYTVAEARQDAQQIAIELDIEDARKGKAIMRTIVEEITASVQDTIMYPRTDRLKSKDPGFHVFNFSDNNGFAIISGDKRAFGRLGWSGKGRLEKESLITMFLTRAAYYIQDKRKEVEAMRGDNAHISLLEKLSGYKIETTGNNSPNGREIIRFQIERRAGRTSTCTNCDLYTYSYLVSTANFTNKIVQPILQTEWNQNASYNNNFGSGSNCSSRYDDCSINQNSNYSAGCVPVAASQVIAHYWGRNPARARFGNDWPIIANTDKACLLTQSQTSDVASLVRNVYGSYGLGYKSFSFLGNGTFTLPYPENGICSSYGFVQGEWRSYNKGDLVASLRNGSPVLTYGTQHLWCVCLFWLPFVGCVWEPCVGDPTNYHEWVQDGLRTVGTQSTYRIFPVDYRKCTNLPSYDAVYTTVTNTYVHNN